MEIFADIVNQRFAQDFRHANDAVIQLTQNDDQPLRLFSVQPSQYPGTGHPFYYTAWSGDEDYTCVVSLRDVDGSPLSLASTGGMTPVKDGFEGVLHLNTAEVATFLSGRSQRDCDLCIDLIDGSGNHISPFRRSITLRATDGGSTTPILGVGVIGTAGFVPNDLPATVYQAGVIASVARTVDGLYDVTFASAQPDTNYTADPTASGSSGVLVQIESKGTTGFTIHTMKVSDQSNLDADYVEVTVSRLSS